ncbi:MAG: S8 family serine peptidase [Meiothermus sp.]|uniref:S8 family serine peptidase n=1 Tax=Meiothermus sp. TaxID=1955249 RepID=UPI0025DB5E75|nr:S8 family serine peptidase [Meiothermus sp.]MCS7194318.1 S8 family serine peptidase [Meiothermus sp.]
MKRFSALLSLSFLLLAACGGNQPRNGGLPPSTITVNTSLSPQVPSIPDPDGGPARPLASVKDQGGAQADFVANEVLVLSDDTARVEALAARYNGRIVRTVSVEGAPKLHLVRLNPSQGDAAQLARDLRQLVPDARSDLEVSSQEALNLLATVAREGVSQNLPIAPNFVLYPQGIAEGRTSEGANTFVGETEPYRGDAFSWPYMNTGSPQNIGVGEAWRLLQAAGKLSNRVKIAIIDGGFERDFPDYPDARSFYGTGGWGTQNFHSCRGNPCPWHGTQVTQAAMAKLDNSFGVAGPAGPVAELMAVQTPGGDLFQILEFIGSLIGGLAAERPRIINMSGAASIPAVWGEGLKLLIKPILDAVLSFPYRPLLIASAGNAGVNVDAEDEFLGIRWEGALWVPCELDGVICVGGMRWNATERDGYSNYGTKADSQSVDIYGPFTVWASAIGERARELGEDVNGYYRVRRVHGTSFSAPFVAGVAALIIAANPALSAAQVEEILLSTAHVGGVHPHGGHQRRVNALGAVQRALGANVPPFVRFDAPREGEAHSWRRPLRLVATAYDPDTPGNPSVSFSSSLDGPLGSGTRFPDQPAFYLDTTALRPGNHRLTATATSGGQQTSSSVNITIRNDPPTVRISAPSPTDTLCTGSPVVFEAQVSDPNNPSSHHFPVGGVTWWQGSTLIGSGFSVSRSFSSPGTYTITVRATDDAPAPHTLFAEESITINVVNCTNLPPTASITDPSSDLTVVASGSDSNGQYHTVNLTGTASDPEGASLIIEWYTDRGDLQPGGPASGKQLLGTGLSLSSVRLYAQCGGPGGRHTITLEVDDGTHRVIRSRIINVVPLC